MPRRARRSGPGRRWISRSPARSYNVLPNTYLSGLMNTNLEQVGGFTYTAEEIKFAEELRKTLTDPPDVQIGSQEKIRPLRAGQINSGVDRLRRRQLERADRSR